MYTKELHERIRNLDQRNELLLRSSIAKDLLDEIDRLAALESPWIKYVDGDISTYPKGDGDLYDIVFDAPEDEINIDQEFYTFAYGWATDKVVRYYRPIPPAPDDTRKDDE